MQQNTRRRYIIGVKVFNMLPFYIKQSLIIQKILKLRYKNINVKIPFIPWMNILNAN